MVPAAGLHSFLAAQASAEHARVAASQAAAHIVGAGDDRFGHPHTLGYSSLCFKVSGTETGGNLFIIEHNHLTSSGPPLHMHPAQEEWFFVSAGEVAFQIGEQRVHLKAGESVLGPRGIPHTFAPVSATPCHMLIAFCPAGKMEQFFLDSKTANPATDPAAYYRRYDMEYIGPSPFAKS